MPPPSPWEETLLRGGQFSYSWRDQNGQEVGQDAQLDTDLAGTYELIVTDNSNGCSSSDIALVNQDVEAPIADAGDDGILNCLNGSLTLGGNSSAGVDFTYNWTDENGQEIGQDIQVDVTNPGTYEIVVTNLLNGCSSASSVIVTEDIEEPIADAGNAGLLTCDVNSYTIGGASSTGAQFTYLWTNGSGQSLGETQYVTVNTPGSYPASGQQYR